MSKAPLTVIYQKSLNEGDVTPNEAQSALRYWVSSMQTGDIDRVAAIYDPEASFWGTIAEDLATEPEEFKAYFEAFFTGRNNIQISIDECYTQSIGPACLINGLYTFNFEDDAGTPQSVSAAYSFVFRKNEDGDVHIINHHSSKRPVLAPQNGASPS